MGRTIKSERVRENYTSYDNMLYSDKTLLSPVIVINKDRDKDENHSGSLKRVIPVQAEGGDSCNLIVKIKESDRSRFNFALAHDISKPFPASRFDPSGCAHRNNLADIRLQDQQITTPHFHKFREDGCFIAYKTADLLAKMDDISLRNMFPLFCKEYQIIASNRTSNNELEISIDGELKLELLSVDPHENVIFDL